MFGSLGFPELMFIFVIALILFGPRQLPKIGQSLGRALGEFRRASNEFKRTVEEEIAAEEIRAVERDLRKITEPPKSDSEDAEPAKEPAEKPGNDAADSSGKESGGA